MRQNERIVIKPRPAHAMALGGYKNICQLTLSFIEIGDELVELVMGTRGNKVFIRVGNNTMVIDRRVFKLFAKKLGVLDKFNFEADHETE